MGRQPAGFRQKLIGNLRADVKNAVPFDLTFAPHRGKLTDAERAELQEYLRKAFHQWADTWVHPIIDKIERSWIGDGAKGGAA